MYTRRHILASTLAAPAILRFGMGTAQAATTIKISHQFPGGSISAGMAIYDTMQFVKPDVVTYCVGQSASIAAVLLASGTPKKRYALPNSRVLIHQPWMSGLSGQATDIDIHAKEIIRTREALNKLLAGHTGQTLEKIERDVERDFIMTAEQAKAYGLVDEIITKHT